MELLWWHWVLLGLLLAVLELLTPGVFFIIFFGVAALVVGLLSAAGLAGPSWTQWLLFAVLSIVCLAFFRNPLMRRLQVADGPPVDSLTREIAVAIEDIPPGVMGRAELRGTTWSAKNIGGTPLVKGERCRVQRVEGLTLYILPEGA